MPASKMELDLSGHICTSSKEIDQRGPSYYIYVYSAHPVIIFATHFAHTCICIFSFRHVYLHVIVRIAHFRLSQDYAMCSYLQYLYTTFLLTSEFNCNILNIL